tara:strand:+ start:280877 stop:282412 length:1536 start_codon:yes stop_codon:yes gene_type:complete
MNEYFAYTRVSTAKQGQKGVSLQEQRDAIERYAQRKQIVISQWFEERQTAAKTGRPVFNDMVRRLRKRKAVGVILHKVDRATRNFRDWADLGELGELNIEIHFAMDELDLNSRSGQLMADIQVVMAADNIRNLREETKKGIYGRFKQGLYPLPAPMGYRNNGPGNPKTIDPKLGPLIAEAFDLYATGEYSFAPLRAHLAKRGLTTSKGKPISKGMMGRILNNPFYMGLIKVRRTGETFQGVHDPLISPTTFKRVQTRLAGKTVNRVCRHSFLYKRLLQCGKCQSFLIGEVQKGRTYYRCRSEGCSGACINEVLVTRQVEATLSKLRLSEAEAKKLADAFEAIEQEEGSELADERQRIVARHAHLEQRLDRLDELVLDETMTRESYRRQHERIICEQNELKQDMAKLGASGAAKRERFEKFFELVQSPSLSHFSQDRAEMREILKTTTSNFWVDGKNVSVELFLSYQALEKRHSVPTGYPTGIRTPISWTKTKRPTIRRSGNYLPLRHHLAQ